MKDYLSSWAQWLVKFCTRGKVKKVVTKNVFSEASSNVHIEEYLGFFLGLNHPPEFAVLLSGPWGIGKTYLIKRVLESTFREDPAQCVYVSLYGITSVEQISWEILGQIYPALNTRAGKWGRRLFEAGLKKLPLDVGVDAGEIPIINKPRLYVFDDLERANMPLDTILGFINTMVEHDGEKVVLVANEAELDHKSGDEYRRKKEKLIGKTLGVNSSLNEAVSFFFTLVDDQNAYDFIESERDRVTQIFNESGIRNLRLLKQTMWDFERIFKLVPNRYSQHKNFPDFVSLFFALSIEYKSGALKADDLMVRTSARMKDIRGMTRSQKGKEEVEFSPFKSLNGKYSSVEIYTEWPTDSFMFEVLVNGRVLPHAVEKEMSSSPYFGIPRETPNWRLLWEFLDIPESVIQGALDEIWEEIDKKQITDHLHFLQVWGILFFYAEMEIIAYSRPEIFEKGKSYLDDLVREDLLPSIDPNDPREMDITSFDGYVFREIESEEMIKLIDLVERARKETLNRRLPNLAERLCDQMLQDVDDFKAAISSPSAKNSVFSVPILASIPVGDFWDQLLKLEPLAQSKVFSGLKARFEGGRLSKELSAEGAWLREFDRLGRERIKDLNPILRAQLKQRLSLFSSLLAEIEERE